MLWLVLIMLSWHIAGLSDAFLLRWLKAEVRLISFELAFVSVLDYLPAHSIYVACLAKPKLSKTV